MCARRRRQTAARFNAAFASSRLPSAAFALPSAASAGHSADASLPSLASHGTASIVLAWEKLDRRIEFAQCGGGYVFHRRGSALTLVMEANTLGRLSREHRNPVRDEHASMLVSMLGAPDPTVALASIEWEPDDLVVIISASAKLPTEELSALVRAAGDDMPTMAGRIGQGILDRSRTFGVTVIVQRLRSTEA